MNSDEKFLYARERRMGYERALREYGLPFISDFVVYTHDLGFEHGQQAMRKILQLEDRPTAVFAVSDVLAIGALKEINTSGLHVPNDIAVVGFDKIDFSNMTNPALTTVAQPMYKMGSIAARMLIDKIQGKPVDSVVLGHELVIRESTTG